MLRRAQVVGRLDWRGLLAARGVSRAWRGAVDAHMAAWTVRRAWIGGAR